MPRSALIRVILAPATKLPELSVTVPLIVAENVCDWANRRGVPHNMAKANITIVIVVTICARVVR
jgi:hypothetical protein